MKQTTKIILHSTSHLILFFGVIIAAASLQRPDHAQQPSISEPHHEVTSSQVSVSEDDSAQLASPSSQQPPQIQKTTYPTRTLSPKHQEIKHAVTKEYVYHMFAAPNDPGYADNWALAKIQAPTAWDAATGNGSTTIAIIDSGYALAHEDLENQWATNANEMGMTQIGDRCWTGVSVDKQSNNCDDDNNGYVDDWRGWNFVIGDNNPQTGRENPSGDGTRHGTQVSGVAGARGNNGIGVATVNWNTQLMPLQALSDDGYGYTSDVTAAMYYAVDNEADVINLSLGSYSDDPAMRAAIAYASSHNVVVVAASGNCGDGTGDECIGISPGTVAYPAAYPDVIAVGATTQSDQRASFSSYGSELDVSAPGYAIPPSTSWSETHPTSLYSGYLYGTSFASPQVASLVALVKSVRPSSSIADITALIDASATKIGIMNGLMYSDTVGHGIINVHSAVVFAGILNATGSATPQLLQAGSYQSERTAPTSSILGSGCVTVASTICTIQMTSSSGHKRFLPYTIANSSGESGWSWIANTLGGGSWELRARNGENTSTVPYTLTKTG